MNDFSEKMKQRLFHFAVECGKLCIDFQEIKMFYAYSNQLIRSSASVGANYRAACRAKSDKDFINKLKIVEEEADESMYWLEIMMALTLVLNEEMKRLHKEGSEILAITVKSITTKRKNLNN